MILGRCQLKTAAAFEGLEQVDEAASYNNLGNLHWELGETNEAKDYCKRALEISLKRLGPNHVIVAASYNNLGILHSDLGETDQAKHYYKRALKISQEKLGPEHVDVAASYYNLGILHRDLGETDQAKDYLRRALEIRLKKLGPEHIDVAASYNNLGILHRELGETDQAKDYYKRALEIRLKKLGPDHVDVAASYYNLGILHQDLGETDQAKDYYKRALEISLKKLGPEHVDVAASYYNLGILHRLLGETDQAKDYYKRALEISHKRLGPEHVDVAASYNNLGILHRDLGETDKAKDYFKRALKIRLKKLGPEHVDVAASYNNLGISHKDLGETDQANDNLKRSLEIRLKKLGPEHVDVAASYYNLGIIHQYLGETDQAKDYYKRALEIRLKKLKPEHVDVVASYNSLGYLHSALGETDEAKEYHNLALEISRKKLGPEHGHVAASYNSLDAIPSYVLARGDLALEAYHRGLQTGRTFDKRIKILLIGQDRVGKTSLGKNLRGEQFNQHEPSTDGVKMMPAIKEAGLGAWRNPASLESTSAFDLKCAELVTKELLSFSPKIKDTSLGAWSNPASLESTSAVDPKCAELVTKELPSSSPEKSNSALQFTEVSVSDSTKAKRAKEESGVKGSGTEELRGDELTREVDRITAESKAAKDNTKEQNLEQIPVNVASLVEAGLQREDTSNDDSIWPVIWDFAGQAVYHAIHPMFLSEEGIYVLALDLSRELDAPAHCRVQPLDHGEVEVASPDSEDTNLDHILKWLDLVHSLETTKALGGTTEAAFPPVILVGTHADSVEKLGHDPHKEMKAVCEKIFKMAPRQIVDHIYDSFVIDNTKAGNPDQQEDSEIVSLRQKILELAEKMPHTKKEVPLQWLRVEEKIYEMVEKGKHHLPKNDFQRDVADAICHFDVKDDVEELLHFLQARGTVIYHDIPENPDTLVVLDPQWLIRVLKMIITVNPTWKASTFILGHYQKLGNTGFLSEKLLEHAFGKLNLEGSRENLLQMMEKFNLICASKGCKGSDFPYFVPCMLTLPMKDKRSKYMDNGPLPVFLTFNTNYVPAGLFCRLVALFWELVSQLSESCKAPTLYANAARFNVSKSYHLTVEAQKTVIGIKLWTNSDPNKDEEKKFCRKLLSNLKRWWTTLHRTCRWLESVSWEVSVQCTLCKPCPDKCLKKADTCIWHKKRDCCHPDCCHYLSLRGFAASCEYFAHDAPSFCQEKLDPWTQAFESIEFKEERERKRVKRVKSVSTGNPNYSTLKDRDVDSSRCITDAAQGRKPLSSALKVTLLASEWSSSKGGLSTINRNLAILLGNQRQVDVTVLVPQFACSEEEKRSARSQNVSIKEAEERPGYCDLDWLSFPPRDLDIDIVVGHGAKLGKQAQLIKESHDCKWIQVVHTAPEELGIHKSYSMARSKGEEKKTTEVDLCKLADAVAAVGPKLTKAYSSYLRSCEKHQDIIQLTPSTFGEFSDVKQVAKEMGQFKVLTFGRGDREDFRLKGYDISAKAIAELSDRSYCLIFVGASKDKQDKVAKTLLKCGIPETQLIVREFVQSKEILKELFCEVDLCIMPSRTEGFGLTALEAMSAGLPILVSSNSGFGEALCTVPFGKSHVVESEQPKEWAKAIAGVRQKKRTVRLREIQQLRAAYEEKFTWERLCSILLDKMKELVYGSLEIITQPQQMQLDAREVNSKADLTVDMKKIASDRGFKMSDNEGSGNCMFYALSDQLEIAEGIKINHDELRQILVQYLSENPKLQDGTDLFDFVHGHQSWADYLGYVEQDGAWGDHVFLTAAANYYKISIRVVSSLPGVHDVIIKPQCRVEKSETLVLGHIPELHYVSLRPIKG